MHSTIVAIMINGVNEKKKLYQIAAQFSGCSNNVQEKCHLFSFINLYILIYINIYG